MRETWKVTIRRPAKSGEPARILTERWQGTDRVVNHSVGETPIHFGEAERLLRERENRRKIETATQ